MSTQPTKKRHSADVRALIILSIILLVLVAGMGVTSLVALASAQ